MNKLDKIYVAGHTGLLGSAIVRMLNKMGYYNLVLRTSKQLDLVVQSDVNDFFETEKPDYVFICAGKVGGIHANNTQRAEFIYLNAIIQFNIIHAAYVNNCKKLLAIGSSCIYPKNSCQPIKEEYLLTGKLESTNEPYAIAKIAALKMCDAYRDQYGCNFISAMPTNLYGEGDNYDLENSHVLPALIRKFHEAKTIGGPVVVWGTGTIRREFLLSDDCADGCIFLMNNYNEKGHVNIGTGVDIEINELVSIIKDVAEYEGDIINDLSRPDGTKRKLLDVSKINKMGWRAKTELREGIKKIYDIYADISKTRTLREIC